MFIHGESYRPPFIPQASSANQHSAVCIATMKLSWPRKGTAEYMIVLENIAQKVSKLQAVGRASISLLFIHAFSAFEASNTIPSLYPITVLSE